MIHSYKLKHMMRSYDRQIGNGQRLERIKKYLNPLTHQEDEGSSTKDAKRTQMVEQISSEIIDNLLGSGSTSPIVQEIKQELKKEFPRSLKFMYSAGDSELQILEERPEGNMKLLDEDRDNVLARLREITHDKVRRTMVCP